MNIETLAGIAKTAWAMDITVSLEVEGLLFTLARGRHTIAGLVPWIMLEQSRDPHGVCACTMGDMSNAMKVAQGLDDDGPRVVKPSHWSGTGRAGNGGDI